jgi:signal transduction histidine kinase/DNA-binding response OmpR family regulator/serine phosphatase RsbU (regulator of sigma subunit)
MSAAPDPVDLLDALAASGDVGLHLAAVDWAATPLGEPSGWDRSLRTMVRSVVSSRFSMWMAWGPELTFFCNEAYRRDTLGSKYPWALGRPAREVWEEIWDDIGPRIDGVLTSGESTWDESLLLFLERSGFTEETYHTFSYSPLTDDRGRVAGMLCVVTEETERVVGDQRMRALRDIGALQGAGREAEAYLQEATHVLEASGRALPFTLAYLAAAADADVDADAHGTAWLAAASGIAAQAAAAPASFSPHDPAPPWPLARALAGEFIVVEDLASRFSDLPTGSWSEPPQTAAVVPLHSQVAGAPPIGCLVVGLNRFRPFDAEYRVFLELLAAQLASGVAGARAFEAERRRVEELAHLDTAKTTFFTNVSHELRTPLTLMLAPAEDMLASGHLGEANQRRLELIIRNGERLLRLVNTLLDFSRLERGRTEAQFEPMNLSTYTLELVSMFESAAQQAGVAVELDCPPLPGPVWVDREMWAKIVLNLVSNALKFTLEGSIAVHLHPHGEGAVQLEVVDTGIGIPEAEQSHLFERFHRVTGSSGRTYEGTGIGLALVAELLDVHGGRCTVQSTVGIGSRFRVELPYGPDQLPADQLAASGVSEVSAERAAGSFLAEVTAWLASKAPSGPSAALAPQAGADGPRLLVVDDNADMRNYVTDLLKADYTVRTAADGVSGLAAALEDPPDLILTDVTMPNMDGFALLSALRADPRTMHIPVVMLSARAGEEGVIEGLEAGADDYLVKPFTARELTARVASNLELDRARRVRDQLQRGQQMQDQAERLAQVGSWEIDLETAAFRGSEQFQRMLGPDGLELIRRGGFHGAIADIIDARDRAAVSATITAALKTGAPFEYETRIIGMPDRLMFVRGEVIPGTAEGTGVVRGFMRDITQQRQAEQAIAVASAAREAAEREHAIADELQRSLLPADDLSNSRLQAAGFYRAGVEGTRAGGDWYDVIDLGATRSAIVIGDVSGRGVRAASLMGQLRAAIHAHAQLDLPPADVLDQLDTLVRELGHGSLVTCIYGIHDFVERTFVYASAGHLPAIMSDPRRKAAARLPGPTGPPLGSGTAQYTELTADFAPGALLVLYTDGLVERRREPIDINITVAVQTVANYEGPLDNLPQTLVSALGAQEIDDDVAILAVCSSDPAEQPWAEHEIGPEPTEVRGARRFAAQTLARWGIAELIVQDAVTIVSELATNAIIYGRPPIMLRLRVNAEELVIEVDDALAAMPRKARADADSARGRGLRIVSQLASRWNARPHGKGKTVWCSISLPPSTPAPGD